MTTPTIIFRSTIELSLAPVNYAGNETDYTPSIQNTTDLRRVLTSYNYSPIVWDSNYRLAQNFLRASAFCVDIDSGMTLDEAKVKLESLGINYALITTRSHTKDLHRFRILIPFNRKVLSYTDYLRIVNEITSKHFPNSDPKVKDGARQFFASPADAVYESLWTAHDFDVDKLPPDGKPVQITNAWTNKLSVTQKDGSVIRATSLKSKTPILCPFHHDSNSSAFIDHSKSNDNHFIHCSSCNRTYWMEKPHLPVEDRCSRFYSYQTDVYEAGIVGEQFAISKIGVKKFNVLVGAQDEKDRATMFEYLVKNRHIQHLKRIDHLADVSADKSFFKYLPDDGVFEVHYAPRAVEVEENAFIDDWLTRTFGDHMPFIKQWLAVYCYTNYQKLPTLVLKGDRGTGKNTFAEAVLSVFPTISQLWHGEVKNFTPEVEKKLLIADESVAANEKQYRMLKQRSGQKLTTVNQKFLPEYQVKNNMNIIILSNEHTPIFVQKEEIPKNEKNNQFFVYTMPALSGEIDRHFGDKIESRIGHYVRTELKTVFEKVKDYTDCRYSIPTPITKEEQALFDVNITGLEAEADKFLQRMNEDSSSEYIPFFNNGFFPARFVDSYLMPRSYSKNGVIRNLKERGYLESKEPVRRMIGSKREYAYEMTDKLKSRYQAEK